MPELSSFDLAEIAEALADRGDYEHAWLVDPVSGKLLYWTSDTGIDGQNPIELEELDERLIGIRPTESRVRYQEMADFVEGISDDRAGRRLGRAIDGKGAFRRFIVEL